MRINISISALLVGLFMTASLTALAVPAKPGLMTFTQPDGTVVEASLIGDEHFHFYETSEGEFLLRDADGYLRHATVDADGMLSTSGLPTGKATSNDEALSVRNAISRHRAAVADELASVHRRLAPGKIQMTFPTTGEVRGLIIMAEFEDVKFSKAATREIYERKVNEPGFSDESTYGSVIDYFTTQSGGKFTPKFDIVGPVTLPHDRRWYGMTERLDDLFRDACILADKEGVDFTKYDVNNDYFVDFVFVVFAGHGEAQGGPAECIWPAMKDLSNSVYDYFDGMNLGVAACSCELKGKEGENLDGIGTIVHEFSHILGLPDIYDSSQQGAHGMGHYDIMDIGTYNDDQVTPSGYTAMDKYTLGWIEPEVIEAPASGLRLESFEKTHKAYFIVNPENENEYFTLENRRKEGWDGGIPWHGMVISYVHYDPSHWKRNTVNSVASAGYEHVRIVAADNIWNSTMLGEAGDPFPGRREVTVFSDDNNDAALWQSSKKKPGINITDIEESEDGVITFNYNSPSSALTEIEVSPEAGVTISGNDIIAPEGSEVYDLAGRRVAASGLPSGLYIVRTPSATVKVVVR